MSPDEISSLARALVASPEAKAIAERQSANWAEQRATLMVRRERIVRNIESLQDLRAARLAGPQEAVKNASAEYRAALDELHRVECVVAGDIGTARHELHCVECDLAALPKREKFEKWVEAADEVLLRSWVRVDDLPEPVRGTAGSELAYFRTVNAWKQRVFERDQQLEQLTRELRQAVQLVRETEPDEAKAIERCDAIFQKIKVLVSIAEPKMESLRPSVQFRK